ncbi:MAG: AsmA family protein [Rhodospirillales bacterium]|nr:AsmA family protein [Rhodospirillales bacterium]
MKIGKIAGIAGGVLVLVVIGGVVALKSIDLNKYKPMIAEQAKAATGRDLVISGNLDLKISFSPAVVVEGVSFANAAWGSRPEMVKLKRFEAEVGLLALLSGGVHVKRIVLIEPDILIETDAKGQGNFVFDVKKDEKKEPEKKDAKSGSGGLPPIAVEEVRIEKALFTYKDGVAKKTTTLALDHLSIKGKNMDSPLDIDLAAVFDKKALALAGQVGAPSVLLSGSKPYPVKLALKAGGATVGVDGTIAKPMEGAGLDLKITVEAGEVADLAKLADQTIPALGPMRVALKVMGSPAQAISVSDLDASLGKSETVRVTAKGAIKDALKQKGIALEIGLEAKDLSALAQLAKAELPKIPPTTLSAKVADIEGGYAVSDLKLAAGKTNLTGSAQAKLGDKPKVSAKLASTMVDLSELLPQPAADKKAAAPAQPASPAKKGDGKVFPDDPLPLDGLKAAEADLEAKIDRLVLPNKIGIDGVLVKLVLAGGKLDLSPVQAKLGGGDVAAKINLDGSSGKSAALNAQIDGKGVVIGQLLKEMGQAETFSGGKTDLAVSLRGQGGSVRALMAGLNGDALIEMGEGRVNNTVINWGGGDILTQLIGTLNPMAKKEDHTPISCGVVKVPIKDGLATINKSIAVETARLNVVANGTVNLKTEDLDVGVKPTVKEGLGVGMGNLASLVRVRGTLAEPKVGVDEIEAAKKALSVGSAIATGGVSLLAGAALDKATDDKTPCLTALGKAPAKTAQPAPAAKSGTAPAPAAKEQGGVGGAIGGTLGKIFGK